MSKRNFENFLDAYMDYARDGFCPEEWHKWIGISLIAGALGRKVGLGNGRELHIPNFYIALVSHPGMGKTTAIKPGARLIEALHERNPEFKIIPQQSTEAALVNLMKIGESYQTNRATEFKIHHSAYHYSTEASSSLLKNQHDQIVTLITDYYDCPEKWRKTLASQPEITVIPNVCVNLLTGTTFEFLKTLVNSSSVMNGLASRLIYVVCHKKEPRRIKFGESGKFNPEMIRLLTEDLVQINRLAGACLPTREYVALYEEENYEFQKYIFSLQGQERMQSIMIRKFSHIVKLSIILSVAESDDLLLDERHFIKAKEMIEDVTKENASIISSAMIANIESQSGCNQLILQTLKNNGRKMSNFGLRQILMKNGNEVEQIKSTLDYMIGANLIRSDGNMIELLVEPDAYL